MTTNDAPMTVAADSIRTGETGMCLLLVSLMLLLAGQNLLALPLSLAPGLSAENALLYVIAGALTFKFAVQGGFRFEARELHMCFIVLIGYAVLTMVAASLIVQYDGYSLIRAGIALKAGLFDQFVFFLVFFYGLKHARNAYTLLKWMLVVTIVANLFALLDAYGYLDAPGLVERTDGRPQGVMGESNQTAAFIACFIPALAAFALTSRGVGRLVWFVGLVASAAAMIISASRGGFVALIVASLWALVHFRRYISGRSLLAVIGVAVLVLALAVPMIIDRYGALLATRIIGDSTSSDLVGASSGRLQIWSDAFEVMIQSPVSFLTGFGWHVYDAMPFRYATHNHYVWLWFDLGLLGLICGTLLIVLAIRGSLSAVPYAELRYRTILIAFAMGGVSMAVALFFVNLYSPWPWFWAYAGLVMRIAVNTRNAALPDQVPKATVSESVIRHDPFGWVGTAR